MAQQDVLDYIRKTPHNSNVNVVKGMLDSLGGSSLPEVTNEDNGKVLTVVEGEWNKMVGGTEPLIVDFFEDDDLGETILSGATVDEIAQALKKGSLIARENYASGSITIVNWYPVRYYKLQPNGDITDILFVDIATPEGISYSLSRDGSHYYKED